MNRRRFALGLGISGVVLIGFGTDAMAQEVELTPVPLDGAMKATPGSGLHDETPAVQREMYRGDIANLWDAPWEIGDTLVEIGVTIVQRFIGTPDQGFQLGLDGLVFQSVIYAKHDFQRMLFIGVNSDLSEIADARTLIVTGVYGGVQHNTDSLWEDPILITQQIEVP